MTSAAPVDKGEALDPGVVRAGAAAAARRRELNISQRRLAADGVINAGALIAFEKGRSWPRERTRAKLEEVLRWPPGTIARLRYGDPAIEQPQTPAPATTVGEAQLVAQAVLAGVDTVDLAIEALPPEQSPEFTARAAKILAELRQFERLAAQATRISKVSPPLIKALSAVRRRYDDIMLRAARTPRATLGQRLYAARRSANLTISETAQAAGVSDDDIVRVESEETVSAATAAAVESLITQLD